MIVALYEKSNERSIYKQHCFVSSVWLGDRD
jgi:hypothetical protein